MTAAAAARGAAAELKVIIDPPAGFHIVTERAVLQLQSWTEGSLRGLTTTSPQWTHNWRPISLRPSVDDDLLLLYFTEVINSSGGRDRALGEPIACLSARVWAELSSREAARPLDEEAHGREQADLTQPALRWSNTSHKVFHWEEKVKTKRKNKEEEVYNPQKLKIKIC